MTCVVATGIRLAAHSQEVAVRAILFHLVLAFVAARRQHLLRHDRLVEVSFLVTVHLLLDDILVEHLFVKLEWLLLDQVVVETLTDGLNDVALGVVCILLAVLAGAHILFFELVLVLKGKVLVADQSLRWRHHELLDPMVVKVVHLGVEDLPV
jgi:hypothetical protein